MVAFFSQISVLSCSSGVSYDNRCWEQWPEAQWVAPAPGSGSVAIRSRGESTEQETGCELSELAPGLVTTHQSMGTLSTGTQGPGRLTVAQEPGQLTQSIINFLPRHGKIWCLVELCYTIPTQFPICHYVHDARSPSDIWNPIFNTTNRSPGTSQSEQNDLIAGKITLHIDWSI